MGFHLKLVPVHCALRWLPSILQETFLFSLREWLTAAGSNDNSSGCILNLLCSYHLVNLKVLHAKGAPVCSWLCFCSVHFCILHLAVATLRCVKSELCGKCGSGMDWILLFTLPCKNIVRSALRWAEKSHIRYSTRKAISLYNASLLQQSCSQQIKDCVSFISAAMLPVKEEVKGCAPSVIRYTVAALGYYSLIDSE